MNTMPTKFWGSKLMWWGIVLGMLSGVIVISAAALNSSGSPISSLCGLIFGIFALIFFSLIKRIKLLHRKLFLWLGASLVSYWAGVIVTVFSTLLFFGIGGSSMPVPTSPMWGLPIGGLVGGVIIIFAFKVFIGPISPRDFLWGIVIATSIPLLINFFLETIFVLARVNNMPLGLLSLYILWQTAMLLVLGHALWKEQRRKETVASQA